MVNVAASRVPQPRPKETVTTADTQSQPSRVPDTVADTAENYPSEKHADRNFAIVLPAPVSYGEKGNFDDLKASRKRRYNLRTPYGPLAVLAGIVFVLFYSFGGSGRLVRDFVHADGSVSYKGHRLSGVIAPHEHSDLCPQSQPLNPVKHSELEKTLVAAFSDETYKQNAYKALSGALQVPTESYDDLGPVGVDPRWETFGELHAYLEKTYSRVFQSLEITKVNTYGIVLKWQGTDDTALPVLMTAHQGEWIWGRGSCDDKSDVIASLHAIDALLQYGFEPSRTFVWAYGFDEEASGTQGAGHLATYLEKTYGTHGFALMLDEGGSYGTPYGNGVVFATPSLSEKGYLDVRIEVTTKGGHSSIPPKHTAIGILSSMVVAVEENPHEPQLVRGGSPYNSTMCAATYGRDYPEHIRELAFEAADSDEALAELKNALLVAFPKYEAILSTTQAVDLIQGGVKVNALPEKVSAVVNHRIAEHSSVQELQKHMTDTILPVARKYNLTVDAFGVQVSAGGSGHVALSDAWGTALEPAPVTPTGKEDPYQILAGTIMATIQSVKGYNATGVVVAPQLATGNTDTRYYWNVTKNIFRYKHSNERDRYNGAHTVNEAVRAEGWVDSIRFYTKFMLNCDEHL